MTGLAIRPRTAAQQGVPEFTFLVPDDWTRLRAADPEAFRADVHRLAERLTRARADRDRVTPQVAELIAAGVAGRRTQRTVELHLAVPLDGAPAAALVVDVVPASEAPGDPLRLRALFLAAATRAGGDAEVVGLSCGRVARTRRQLLGRPPEQLPAVLVQYQHPAAGGGFVLLSFSTPQLQLREPLSVLFDAIAGSFRWLP